MSKYEFARRLKRIVYGECEIVKAETNIAHRSAKYCEKLSGIKTTLIKQEQEINKYRICIQNMERENKKLHKLKQEQENQLAALLQKVDQLEVEYNKTLKRQIEQHRTALLQMDCSRNIKLATRTYIKINALPQRIQGVTVSEKDSSSQWNPFCIDPSIHTQKEVEDIIWHESNSDSQFKKTWETLILGNVLEGTSKCTETSTSNGKVSVVV